ncbi:MAG: DUF885 domain-containing protein [Elusimicrobia bacterium]|nr:DUF885 domain-containing protein [Elusimicrobiota bacterium]
MRGKILISFLLFFSAPSFSYEENLTDEQIQGALEQNRMNEVFERYIATIVMYDPERASAMGIHDSDHMLTNRGQETLNQQIKSFEKLKSDLENLDKEKMYVYLQADYFLLNSMLENDIYNYKNMNLLSKYPQNYLKPLELIYMQMSKETGNYIQKASNSIKRLKLYPQILLQAERNISHPPKIWTEYAIERTQDAYDNMSDFFPLFKNYVRLDPALKTQLDETVEKVKEALKRYQNFLKKEVLKKSDGEPFVGEYTYGFYLDRWHGLDHNTASAYRFAKKYFKNSMKELKKEAKNIDPSLEASQGWSAVLKKMSPDHPSSSDLIKTISDEVARASNHMDEYKVVAYPKMRFQIKSLPAFLSSSLPYAYYSGPLAMEDDKSAELYLLMPDEKDSKEKNEAMMSAMYSYANIELLTAGMMVPGLHLRANEVAKSNSRIRRNAWQPVMYYGWQVYAEKLAEEMGFYSSMWTKFLRVYVNAIRAARAYVDVGFHTGKMNYDDAVGFFVKEMNFSKKQAEREVLTISMNPTIAFSYVIGFDKIYKMRSYYLKSENKYFDLRSFHNDFLQLGNLSIDSAQEQLKLFRKRAKKKSDEE